VTAFGVDEAGKGPVLGSMFAAAVYVPEHANLPAGIDDSKRVSASRREELVRQIRETSSIGVGVAEVTVRDIDGGRSMNLLTVDIHSAAVNNLDKTVDDVEGIFDAPIDPDEFVSLVDMQLDDDPELTAFHSADETSKIVGAASLVAKQEREEHMSKVQERYERQIGSGYPSDTQTITFLQEYVQEHGRLPECARQSWNTSQEILADYFQTGLNDF